MKKKLFYLVMVMAMCIGFSAYSYADQTIVAAKVKNAPKIDGVGDDPEWKTATQIIIHDNIAKIDVILKAVYTDQEIFFLVVFPDADESREHKPLVWDKEKKVYVTGTQRGDGFVFKWNMEIKPVDLSVFADNSYKTDVWYWKACRTDPVGYADDTYNILSMDKLPDSIKIISKKGNTFYYGRYGDDGTPAYLATEPQIEYKGDKISMFKNTTPTGSRADIRAKGVWKEGKWTIEFKRLLFTGNQDDLQFDTKGSYQFGISVYEIGGKKPDPKEHPYGAGDISEAILLKFAE